MTEPRPVYVLGVDSGGSGLRVALAVPDGGAPRPIPAGKPVRSAEPVRTGPRGIDAAHLLGQLLPMARALLERAGGGRITAVAVGAAGWRTLGDDLRAELPSALGEALGVRRVALAADAVTAYAGALGESPGAVVAAGTGLIALGTDLNRLGGGPTAGGICSGTAAAASGSAVRGSKRRCGRTTAGGAVRGRSSCARSGCSGRWRGCRAGSIPAPTGRRSSPRSHRRWPAVRRRTRWRAPFCGTRHGTSRRPRQPPAPRTRRAKWRSRAGCSSWAKPLLMPLRAELAAQLPRARQVPAAGDPLDGALRVAADIALDGLRLPQDACLLSAHSPHSEGA